MNFQDPNELSTTLNDLDQCVVAIKKVADGGTVTREIDGKRVTRKPILANILVFEDGEARSETTLVFPDSLKRTIEQSTGYVVGRLNKGVHPTNPEWSLWTIETISGDERQAAVTAFMDLTS